jgi:signal transduction histidine kinase/ligand-binding sensor domain-containing protein
MLCLLMLVALHPAEKICAQNAGYRFDHLTVEDGLSHNVVRAMLLDSEGFLWVGTDEGLSRYDGYGFRIFHNDPLDSTSVSGDFVLALSEDQNGRVWVGAGGLNAYNRATESFDRVFSDQESQRTAGGNAITALCPSRSGELWVGTPTIGLMRFHPGTRKLEHFRHDSSADKSLISNSVMSIFEDRSGSLWVGTAVGLDRFDSVSKTFSHYRRTEAGKDGEIVSKIYEDKRGELWIGTDRGLFTFDRTSLRFKQRWNGAVSAILEDRSGALWVGTRDQGLIRLNEDRLKSERLMNDPEKPNTLSSNHIRSLCLDSSGVLWIGTFNGLDKFNPQQLAFRYEGRIPGNNYVQRISEDRMGALWISSYTTGLTKFDRRTGTYSRLKHNPRNSQSISGDNVQTVYEDRHGNLWICTSGAGLNRFEPERSIWQHFLHDPKNSNTISSDFAFRVYEDRAGIYWIATGAGLDRFDRSKGEFKHFTHDSTNRKSLSDNFLWDLYADTSESNSELLWLCSPRGLTKFNISTGEFEPFTYNPDNPNSLSHNRVYSVLVDQSSILWVGTEGGLNRFDRERKTFTRFTTEDGLPNNSVWAILEDSDKNLWFSTSKGLCKYIRNGNRFVSFDSRDGLNIIEFNAGAACRTAKGELCFGGVNGFIMVDPKQIHENVHIPPILVTGLRKLNQPMKAFHSPGLLPEIELSYKENVFSIEFAALDFVRPDKNQYAYKLEGVHDNWIKSGTRRYVTYANLDPGRYLLRVKGSNNDGIWNERGASLVITITPPFWKTWWSYASALALMLAILYVVRKRKIQQLRKETEAQQEFSRRLIDSQEQERKRIASELHDSVGQDLLIIRNRAEVGLSQPGAESEAADQLRKISEIALQGVENVREISYDLRPYQLERLGLTKAIHSILNRVGPSSPIRFTTDIQDIDGLIPKEFEIHLYRIVQEGVNNILKHSAATEAHISIGRDGGAIGITIQDNGKGIERGPKASSFHDGEGFGLKNISERARILDGAFSVESSASSGTTISIRIPIQQTR